MKKIATLICAAAMLLNFSKVEAQTNILLIGDTTNMVMGGTNLPYQSMSNSYAQELVLGSELNGPAMITGLDLYCANSGIGRQCTIYLANTYVDRLSSFVPYGAMFQQVVVDTFGLAEGWNHFEFSTPFYYTGFGNLVVAFDSPWAMFGGDYYCERTQNISRYSSFNLAYLTPSSPTYATAYRNVMRLHTQPVPAPAATCPAPTLAVDAVGATEVSLSVPGGSGLSWTVDCITDGDSAWRTGGYGTSDTTYTMPGLTPSTHYTFRLTSSCPDTITTVMKHILTNCVPDTLPYVEDFEGMYSLPDCLRSTPGSAGNSPELAWSHSHSGSVGVKLNGGTLILPLFDVPTDSLELSFWAQNGTVNATLNLYVGVVSDPVDPATFVPVDTIVCTGWNPVVVRFDSHPGITGQIAIRTANPIMTYMYIDDIEVHRVSPCQTITTVTVDQVTDVSAMVHWVDGTAALSGADSVAVEYEVAYGPSGFAIDSTHIVANIHTDSLLLTGLTPYTVYDVYVRSDCGGAYTNWSPVLSFCTFCSLLDTLPYTEDFDSYTGYPLPSNLPCWRGHVDMNTCVVDPAGGGHSGSRALRWEWSSYDATVQYAVLPAINSAVLPLNTLQLSFWAKNTENTYHMYDTARVVVGVMTDPEVDSTFQAIDTVVILGDDWYRYDIPLSGTGNYVALRSCQGLGTRNRWRAFLDDIQIDLSPSCQDVTGVTLSALTATTATVRWDGQPENVVWQTYIDTVANAVPEADTSRLTIPECTFDGLTTGTPYYVWVRAICTLKNDTSQWEGPLQVTPGVWNMRANKHDALSLCGVTVYDNGGAADHFSAQHSSLVIMPDAPGHLVSIGGHCDIGSVSSLTVYDGVGTSGTILWTKSVNNMWPVDFGPVVSETGPITLAFEGNTSFNYYNDGFELSVSCIPDTCIVHHLRLDTAVAATDSTLALTWECNGASSYELEYGPVGFAPGTGTYQRINLSTYQLTGLSSLDRLEVHVRSLCGEGDTGAWVRGIFNTEPCADALFRENFDSTMQYNLVPVGPVGYNGTPYSYVQTLVSPESLVGLEEGITALAFLPATYVEGLYMNNITVWLANVSDTSLNDGPILPDATHNFVKVIDSANACHTATTNWQTLRFDRPFLWDGHSTLLVAVLREDGGYSSSVTHYSAHFRHSDLVDTVSRTYLVVGLDPIDIDSANSYTEPYYSGYGTFLTGDLRLIGNPCGTALCEAPVIDSVTTDSTSVTIVWHGTGNDYQLTISPDSQGLGIISITDTTSHFSPLTFHLTGLQPSTNYRVSLRQNCTAADLGYSDWVSVDVTTDSAASQPIGIDNVSTYQPINIYPNPTHGKVTVTSPNPLISATVTDMMGRQVYTTQTLCNPTTQSLTMDLSHLPQGAYFLILSTSSGKTHTVRLLKK